MKHTRTDTRRDLIFRVKCPFCSTGQTCMVCKVTTSRKCVKCRRVMRRAWYTAIIHYPEVSFKGPQ